MRDRNFGELLTMREQAGFSVCVGLDSEFLRIPKHVRDGLFGGDPQYIIRGFNMAIVEETKNLAVAFKPNLGFYVAEGIAGIMALRDTIRFIHETAPEVPVILDGKFGDIGNTNAGYVRFAFDEMGADAVTLHGFLGAEALRPFLDRKDRGLFVLCRTSNPGAGEFQDMAVSTEWALNGTMPLYQYVAMKVAKDWNERGNCGLVVGATYPDELAMVRQIAGDEMPILVPGVGTQGGDLEKAIAAGRRSLIINSGSAILFASGDEDFREATRAATLKFHKNIKAAQTAAA